MTDFNTPAEVRAWAIEQALPFHGGDTVATLIAADLFAAFVIEDEFLSSADSEAPDDGCLIVSTDEVEDLAGNDSKLRAAFERALHASGYEYSKAQDAWVKLP